MAQSKSPYLHVLHYCMPKIARHFWNIHKLGLGIFNMKGYEK